MKGYVVIDVPDNVKQKIINLRNEILEWKNKPKQEVILFKKISWFGSYEYTCNIPDHLDEYFFDMVYSDKHYYFELTAKAKLVGELYHLVIAGNPVYLGEELAREYNKLAGNVS